MNKFRISKQFKSINILVVCIACYFYIQQQPPLELLVKELIMVEVLFLVVCFLIHIGKEELRKQHYLSSSIYKIDKMTGEEFEELLCYHFKRYGYTKCKMTKRSCDFGADLVMSNGTERIVVQAKRYQNKKVGISAVQQVEASKSYYHATKGMVVTNNYFTPSAKKLALKCGIELWDRNDLIKKFKIVKD